MNKEEFIKELKKINININDKQLEQLDRYYQLLVKWNEKINLTRIIEEKEVYLKHFYDSLTLFKVVNLNDQLNICDVGTGAGFPGLVLKIVFPNLNITLIDSLQKRINFLNAVIDDLHLNKIIAVHSRAEEFSKISNEKFDIVTSRAVSNLNNLLTYCIPLVKENGLFVPMKANCDDEIKEAEKNIRKMNIEIIKKEIFFLPYENSKRTLIVIKKTKKY